jgi:hypothetical protein
VSQKLPFGPVAAVAVQIHQARVLLGVERDEVRAEEQLPARVGEREVHPLDLDALQQERLGTELRVGVFGARGSDDHLPEGLISLLELIEEIHNILFKIVVGMEMTTFAIESGYAEGILRGLRSSFLTEQQYMQVKNCTNLGELKSVRLS